MKAIMISIKPKWYVKIMNGEKTIEIRKTMPKCDLPIDVYIYCTKEEEVFYNRDTQKWYATKNRKYARRLSNGVVKVKFTLNKVEEIRNNLAMRFFTESANEKELLDKSCLNSDQLFWYLAPHELKVKCCGYAWHIDNLVIFDKPKELSEFQGTCNRCEAFRLKVCKRNPKKCDRHLTKAPQSWCYVEVLK